jgi:uncharacterized protein YndB with AHSA1/START domain
MRMPTPISPLAVRRSTWINASPERVWREFETFERMSAWFGTGHALTRYEPRVGGRVETDAGAHRGQQEGEGLRFGGAITVFDPPHEITWENDWIGHGWKQPSLMTLRLTAFRGGTIVELFHHRFEDTTDEPAGDLNGFEGGWDTHHLEALRGIVEAQ